MFQCNGEMLYLFNRPAHMVMSVTEAIEVYDPFQNPLGRCYGNTKWFPARMIGMLLKINGYEDPAPLVMTARRLGL